jgi:malonate transporter and related proteins
MAGVFSLVFPFFGLILLGYLAARATKQPVEALGWMTTFIIYVALPALFYQLLSKTPLEQLTAWSYVGGSVLSTFVIFTVMFAIAVVLSGGNVAESTIKGLAAAYGNIGYMGPGIALLAFGEKAAVPVAIIFCFENIMHFTVAPMLMAMAGSDKRPFGAVAMDVVRKVALHPFILATAAGVTAAALEIQPPQAVERLLDTLARAAAPCALFAMGVTLALRPLKRLPENMLLIAPMKLIVHPALCYTMLSWIGDFDPVWVFSAVLLAALPTATNVFVIAQQYGVWVERASACVLITTVASVLTVTALLYVMTNGMLPTDLFPGA